MDLDKRIYNKLAQLDSEAKDDGQPVEYGSAFMVHVIFKAIPLVLYILRGALNPLLGKILVIQFLLIFIVVDFWLTKNVNGRRMIGLRWSFDDDQYGVQRFKFQGRVNEDYVSGTSKKLFWVIQAVYMIMPILFLVLGILIRPSLRGINLEDILLSFAILLGAGSNFVFFWRARSASDDRRNELRNKLGRDFTRKMGGASIISFL